MPRLRELELPGLSFVEQPTGTHNAITDVPGVTVGTTTIVDVERAGMPIRTGVTAILPTSQPWATPVHAAIHRLNGAGEMTGSHWVEESGLLTTPIAITNTHAVGAVHEGLVRWELAHRPQQPPWFTLPVVAETYDGVLNDVNGFHVRPEHAVAAVEGARSGPVPEGSVGGGTGMIAHQCKGGTGTASRATAVGTVGVLVQANYGLRELLRVDGRPVGAWLTPERLPLPQPTDPGGAGSIIVVVATDAPLLPSQCRRLAQRAALGIGRLGGQGGNSSGDLIVAFATGNAGRLPREIVDAGDAAGRTSAPAAGIDSVANRSLDPLFGAVIGATEEAVLNAMLTARTVRDERGGTVHALDPDLLRDAWERSRGALV